MFWVKPKTDNTDKGISHFGEVRIPIPYWILFAVLTAGLTWAYQYFGESKTIQFFATGIGVSATVLGAIYVGKGLVGTVRQRQSELHSGRISGALEFCRRWNAPELRNTRKDWADATDKVRGKSPTRINEVLESEKELRGAITAIGNFFEEMAIAIDTKVADEEILRRFFRTIAVDGYRTLSGWIVMRRDTKNRPKIWLEFESLYDRWK